MGRGLLFWILMLIWAVLSLAGVRVDTTTPNGRLVVWSGSLMIFILIALLGWQVYGQAVQ